LSVNAPPKTRKQSIEFFFSLCTILNLSDIFQASVPSTIIRLGEIGTHEIFAVVSKEGIVQWFVKSNDFPNWKFKFKIGEKVPPTTVMGEYHALTDRKFTGMSL
jgi:hypothetical protein